MLAIKLLRYLMDLQKTHIFLSSKLFSAFKEYSVNLFQSKIKLDWALA